MPRENYALSVTGEQGGPMTISIAGSLSLENTGSVGREVWDVVDNKNPSGLTIDLAGVEYVDSTGALLLVELEARFHDLSRPFRYDHLSEKTKDIMDLIDPKALTAAPLISGKTLGVVEQIGGKSMGFFKDIKEVITFGGELIIEVAHSIVHFRSVRWTDVLVYMKKVGVDGLPIVGLISYLLGLIIAFMSAIQLKQFGANIYVPSLLSLAMVRELGPIMTAILVAGRSGSAFAAEIGTMKVNEEVDALSTMGFSPIRFLAIPKVFAAVLVMPFLTLFADIFAIIGGLFIGVLFLDLTVYTYMQQCIKAVDIFNIVMSIIKSVVLGALIAGIGCQRGFGVRGGAQDVGNATTSAVVASLFLIIVVDSIFAVVLNYI